MCRESRQNLYFVRKCLQSASSRVLCWEFHAASSGFKRRARPTSLSCDNSKAMDDLRVVSDHHRLGRSPSLGPDGRPDDLLGPWRIGAHTNSPGSNCTRGNRRSHFPIPTATPLLLPRRPTDRPTESRCKRSWLAASAARVANTAAFRTCFSCLPAPCPCSSSCAYSPPVGLSLCDPWLGCRAAVALDCPSRLFPLHLGVCSGDHECCVCMVLECDECSESGR